MQPNLFGEPEPERATPARKVKEPVEFTPAPMAVLRNRVSRCRSCNAEVVWAVTTRQVKGELRMRNAPFDLSPEPDGNIRLTVEGRTLRAYVIPKVARAGQNSLHKNHFSTCPDSAEWKGKGRQ